MDRISRNNELSMRKNLEDRPDQKVLSALKSLCKTLIWYGQRRKDFGDEQLETWKAINPVHARVLVDVYGDLDYDSLSCCVRIWPFTEMRKIGYET